MTRKGVVGMRVPTTEDRESMYWISNEDWFSVSKETGCFELTDDSATERTV